MKRRHRLIIELLVPPLLAGLLYSVGGLFKAPAEWFSVAWFFILAAYVYGFIPTLAYAVLLEFSFSRGLRPESKWALVVSAGLGALAAPASTLIATGGHVEVLAPWSFLLFPLLGAVVGCAIWFLVGCMDREKEAIQSLETTRGK